MVRTLSVFEILGVGIDRDLTWMSQVVINKTPRVKEVQGSWATILTLVQKAVVI